MSSSDYKNSYSGNDNIGDLQYDDSAFWYYSLAVLSVACLMAIGYMLLQYLNAKKRQNTEVPIPKIPHFQNKLNSILTKRRVSGSLFKKILLLGTLLYLWSIALSKALEAKDFKSFDPYALLELDSSASDKEIKKSYRRLVKLHHPDRNPGNREAYTMFLQITKAYQCLTDPETKETCAKFGNPDGNASFQVGVAIPSFFLKQENTKLVLSLFFVVLFMGTLLYLIGLESTVDLDKYGVSRRTLKSCFSFFKNENMIFKNVVEMMSLSEELRPIIFTKHDQVRDMKRIQDLSIKSTLPKKLFQQFQKPFYLIHNHMKSEEPLPTSLRADMRFIQEQSLRLFVSFFDMGFEIVEMSRQIKNLWEKPLSPRVLQTLCSFAQHFTQGMFLHDSPLLQLPFVDRSNVKSLSNKLKLNSMRDLLAEDAPKRQRLLELVAKGDKGRAKELVDALGCFSLFEVNVQSYVDLGEGERDQVIRQNDIFTVEVEINRKNPNVGYIYSRKLDFLKLELISVLVYFKKNRQILHYETSFTKDRVHKVSFQREFGVNGDFELVVLVESDSYVDVGVQTEHVLKIDKDVKSEGYCLHPDDEEALSKPSFIMTLLNGALDDEDNSDEELEEEEADENEAEEETTEGVESEGQEKGAREGGEERATGG